MKQPEIHQAISRALTESDAGKRVWVAGPVGSGRSTFLDAIAARSKRAVPVVLPEAEEADAVPSLLLQALASFDKTKDEAIRRAVLSAPDLSESAKLLTEAVAKSGRVLVVKIPSSWAGGRRDDETGIRGQEEPDVGGYGDEAVFNHRARTLVRELGHNQSLRVIWLADQSLDPADVGVVVDGDVHRLPAHNIKPSQVDDKRWGVHADVARKLRAAAAKDHHISPLVWRLGVGAAALGRDTADVAALFAEPASTAIVRLVAWLVEGLGKRESLLTAVRRLLLAREAVARPQVAELTGASQEDLPLLTESFAYGDAAVRMTPLVRNALARVLRPEADSAATEAHGFLAQYFKAADGAGSPFAIEGVEGMRAWIQKVHHLGRAGVAGESEWAQQELPCREMYWDRGRHLSIDLRAHAAAAAQYRRCTIAFPDDDYSWHYLGFNLERAGQSRSEALTAYRRAVDLRPAHPWWNRRLVTFLIHQGKTTDALAEWRAAIARVDPDGGRVTRDSSLAESLHRWVARAWLEAGKPEAAAQVLQSVPDEYRRRGPLSKIAHDVADARETVAIGTSVYPVGVPMTSRWNQPRARPPLMHGAAVRGWFPGRVVRISGDAVEVVYATVEPPRQSRLARISMEDWATIAGYEPQVDDFVELFTYANGERRIARAPDADWVVEKENHTPLAYIDARWK